ncbi:MAG: tRNA 2-thiouridine(34) synthase MnmA [bacterium]|nr:tRNA 2-thiouridine(34) synthase MnmA [bacterium]
MNTKKQSIVVGLSGGVDSSVAASICVEQGFNVIGVTLKMKSCDDSKEKTKACCGLDDNIQARLVAEKLDIPHYFLDVREQFRDKVLQYAWNEYNTARTPNPCILCNFYLKFGALLDFAKKLGAIGIATGHYAIIKRDENNNAKLFKGIDDTKNQTYFLAALTQEQLNYSYMPLGELRKSEVRKIAEKLKFPNANKQESQDACFGYKGETFSQTLSRVFEYSPKKGDIIDDHGKILGTHEGIQNFTIGQRKGLGVALGKPAYVSNINLKNNTVTLSTDPEKLLCNRFKAIKMNWLDFPYDKFECEVQTRYRQTPQPAVVHKIDSQNALVELIKPLRAVTPGQGLAVYNKEQLIAGGWIDDIDNS